MQENADTIVEIGIVAVGSGEYGTTCRFHDYSGYRFAIKDTGEVGIFKYRTTRYEPMPGDDWRSTTAFRTSGTNHVVAVCRNVGKSVQLQLWINNILVRDIIDAMNPLIGGDISLYAAADAGKALSVEFDDLVVKMPGPSLSANVHSPQSGAEAG